MAEKDSILIEIAMSYVDIIGRYVKIYHAPYFYLYIKKQVFTEAGLWSMYLRLTKIYAKATPQDKKAIKDLLGKIDFYNEYIA